MAYLIDHLIDMLVPTSDDDGGGAAQLHAVAEALRAAPLPWTTARLVDVDWAPLLGHEYEQLDPDAQRAAFADCDADDRFLLFALLATSHECEERSSETGPTEDEWWEHSPWFDTVYGAIERLVHDPHHDESPDAIFAASDAALVRRWLDGELQLTS